MQSAACLDAFLIKQGMLFFCMSNILGMCRGMCVRLHASYAEACIIVAKQLLLKSCYKSPLILHAIEEINLLHVLFDLLFSPANRILFNCCNSHKPSYFRKGKFSLVT